MGKRKSEHYNWFNSSNNSKLPKNNKNYKWWKKPLKISKIIAYASLFGLSLVGCVQSMVISTDKKTGSGMEFYSSKEKIAPHVATLTEDKIYGNNKSLLYNSKSTTNYWVQNTNTLSDLKKQEKNLGLWKSKTQTLRIEKKDKSSITSDELIKFNNGQYIIANDDDDSYTYKNSQTSPIYYMQLDKGNLSDMLAPYAKWAAFSDFKVMSIAINGVKTATSIEKKFGLDTYAYLSNKYLKNSSKIFDSGKLKGEITDKQKALIQSYATIGQTTGWIYNSKSFDYVTSKKHPPLLSFEEMKAQRAIYSWAGSWHLGPFYALFVYPLAYITGGILNALPFMSGWEAIIAILLVVLLVRSISYALTFKSTLQTVKQQEVQSKVAIINAKYEPYKGNKQMDRRKQQEVQELYKKEGVSPFGAMSQIFLTMPLFLSMWRVIGGMPHLKSTLWLGISFSASSYQELFSGAWQYLPLLLITALIQGAQQLSPRLLAKRREKNRVNIYQKKALSKSNKMQNIMMIVFMIFGLILSAGIQVYWVFTGLFTIAQNTVNHFIIKKQSKNQKRKVGY